MSKFDPLFDDRFSQVNNGRRRVMKYAGMPSAMCHLDYTMSELGGTTDFVRDHTLASGGPYCDCGYKRKKL